jgi:hypothetical protein
MEKNKFNNWVKNNKVLVPIIFWGGLILIVVVLYSLKNTKSDIYHEKECENLTGAKRDYCIQQIDKQTQAEEDNTKSKEIRNILP